jgi:Uma2 family endonuclease
MVATLTEALPDKVEVTPEALLTMSDGGHYELIDGELKERNASVLSCLISSEVNRLLGDHCRGRGQGWLFSAELGYRCFSWNPRRVRGADVSFIRADRLTAEVLAEGHCTIPPDLAVEVVSPNDLASELNLKIEEYLRAGVGLVWVVDPEIRTVDIYRSNGTVDRLRENDRLCGEDVVPGFECQVAAFFPIISGSASAAENITSSGAMNAGPT